MSSISCVLRLLPSSTLLILCEAVQVMTVGHTTKHTPQTLKKTETTHYPMKHNSPVLFEVGESKQQLCSSNALYNDETQVVQPRDLTATVEERVDCHFVQRSQWRLRRLVPRPTDHVSVLASFMRNAGTCRTGNIRRL